MPATESDTHGDSAFTHPDDVDVYFVGASALWPRLANAVPPPTPVSALLTS